jgi:hypothetical protein
MTTTQDAHNIAAAKQEIIEQVERLSLQQLRQFLGYIDQLKDLPKGMSGREFVDLMQELSAKYQITDEEWDEFDWILRESREAAKCIIPEHRQYQIRREE